MYLYSLVKPTTRRRSGAISFFFARLQHRQQPRGQLAQFARKTTDTLTRSTMPGLTFMLLLPTAVLGFSPAVPSPVTFIRPARQTPPVLVAASMPPLPVLAAACTLPTCLGFWKTEYGVSYAYGAAMAICGGFGIRAAPNAVVAAHAAAVCFYGIRLNAFLLWRELNVPRFREFREKIEQRSVESGGRLKRTPFVLSCSLLYYCMAAPLLITTRLAAAPSPLLLTALGPLVGLAWAGLLLAAWGDLTKSIVKSQLGPDTLVTQGPFRLFRHPNYTGEQICWTANLGCAFVGAAMLEGGLRTAAGALAASFVGWAGIFFVLAKATASLEKKQAKRYEQFVSWRKGSWGGWGLAPSGDAQ